MKIKSAFLSDFSRLRLSMSLLVAVAIAFPVLSTVNAQDPPTGKPTLEELGDFVAEQDQEGSEIPLEEKDLDTAEKMQAEIVRLTEMLNKRLAAYKGNQRRVFGPNDLEYNDPLPQRQRLIWRYYEKNPSDPQAAVLMNERWKFMTNRLKQAGFTMSETLEVARNEDASPALIAHAKYWRAYSSLQGTIRSPLNNAKRLVAQAQKFIDVYPDDPRGASILGFIVLRLDRFPEDQIALYRRIGRDYPDTFMGKVGLGKGRQIDAIGEPLEFEFVDVRSGELKTMDDFKGKIVILDFMSTFCRPCMKELPDLMNLQKSLADQDVVFIAVSLDREESVGGKQAILAMLEETGLDWPVFYQGMSFQSDFSLTWGINRVPVQFVIDQNGVLRSTNAGNALEAIIKGLLAESATATAAPAGDDGP